MLFIATLKQEIKSVVMETYELEHRDYVEPMQFFGNLEQSKINEQNFWHSISKFSLQIENCRLKTH